MDAVKTGALISQARKEKELTQKDLAQELHVSIQAVSKWERGLNFPDIALLEPLAELLGLSVSELLSGERNTAPGEELVRSSLRFGLTQLGGKARKWRWMFAALLALLLVGGGFLGWHWIDENTEWLPQKETVLIPRAVDESEMMMSYLMGNDLTGIMDVRWADDFNGFTFQLELWQGDTLLDCQEILAAEGYDRGQVSRRNSLAFLLRLDHQNNSLNYNLLHGGAFVDSAVYELPDVKISGWGIGSVSQPTKVDRETGTILACISLDTGNGIRTILTGNAEKPNLNPGQWAVVLRLVVE